MEVHVSGKTRGRWGEYLVIGKPCFDVVCRFGDARVWLTLHAVNYTNSPHQDQQLHFFRIL